MNRGTAVKIARKLSGVTGAELAAAIGVTPSAMSRYESGQRVITDETAEKISKILGVNLDEIVESPGEYRAEPQKKVKNNVDVVVGNNVKRIRIKLGMTQADVAKELGVSTPTVVRYENGNTAMSADTIVKMCSILCVSANDIFGMTNPPGDYSMVLSYDERSMLSKLRNLDTLGREALSAICAVELKRAAATKYTEKQITAKLPQQGTRYIKLFEMASAAGFNAEVDNGDYKLVLATNEVPNEADFAVPISGDSMEPLIRDGSIVYVQSVEKIDGGIKNGDVGIFSVDGAVYCKQFCRDERGNIYLVSANEARKESNILVPAESNMSVYICGKVILNSRTHLPTYFLDQL